MDKTLEKLAESSRRVPSGQYTDVYNDEDSRINVLAHYAAEDRKRGTFPYDDPNLTTITDFYKGKDIFITGGTGFVGKVLIEKLLRSTPEGGRLFVLIRSRKGQTAQQRLRAMLQLPLFKVLMTGNPDAADRLVAIEGDCGSLGLGLSPADRQTIIDNVSIVFHCAACVRFNLNTAFLIQVNTRGTREMVYLCKEMKKLKSFIHVSTGYSCATKDRRTNIPEVVVPQDIDWRTVIAASERSAGDQTAFHLLFEKLDTKHKINYAFSKALAENVVEEEGSGLPVVIVRPTIVIATYEDPFGGWVDNLYGPISIWDAVGQGILRTHFGDKHAILDYLPVDMCVKTLITAAWHRGIGFRMRSDPDKVDVVNNGTSQAAKVTYAMMHEIMPQIFDSNTRRYIFRYPRFLMTNSFWLFWFITVFSQLPLGILIDTVLRLKGQKPQLLMIFRRLYYAQTRFLHYFCVRVFYFDAAWQWLLESRMPKSDRCRFAPTSKTYTRDYYNDNIGGIIKYVYKEEPCKGKESNKNIMYVLDCFHNVLLIVLGVWIFSWLFQWRAAIPASTSTHSLHLLKSPSSVHQLIGVLNDK